MRSTLLRVARDYEAIAKIVGVIQPSRVNGKMSDAK